MGRELNILTLATAWAGHSGGVTVNRELALALADLGHRVTARVSVPSPPHPKVLVQGLEPIPGVPDERGQLLRADGLPRNIDLIIGHGRFTGGAASYLRDQFYPQAKVVHIVHALTDELDRLRDDPVQANRHAETERILIDRADLALGVGPLLTDDASRLARMSATPTPVGEMIPGVQLGEPPVYSPHQHRLNLLLFGRADDPLKGAGIAADAARQLRESGMNVQFTILGARPAEVARQERELSEVFPVKVKPFTADRSVIEAELRAADLVLMPSVHEGFGLVATEAAGFGVPILVGGNTGAGMFLADNNRVPGNLGRPSVVDIPLQGTAQPSTLWARQARELLTDLGATRRRALDLREFLGRNYTWHHAAADLERRVRELPARALAGAHRSSTAERVAFGQTEADAAARVGMQGFPGGPRALRSASQERMASSGSVPRPNLPRQERENGR